MTCSYNKAINRKRMDAFMQLTEKEIKGIFKLKPEMENLFLNAPRVDIATNEDQLHRCCLPEDRRRWVKVAYEVNGEPYVEARVCSVKNGIAVNYTEAYMRRREPDSMFIGDDLPTDKERFKDRWGQDFSAVRQESMQWLQERELLTFPFWAGDLEFGIPALAIAPANAGFFALGLGLLQGILDYQNFEDKFEPQIYILVAPPFRHTHFEGRQVVVHNRSYSDYEIFSYNLYPGPSAKKGVYSALIHFGEMNNWVTNHASIVRVRTPYNNKVNIMHEGASGGGKSEINENLHRDMDGSIKLATNTITGDEKQLVLSRTNKLMPMADDMVLCAPHLQKNNGKLGVLDAEDGWFIRVDHIKNYGTDPDVEARTVHPKLPLLFFNLDVQPKSTALLWEHIEDEPGVPCPNPRFVLPRQIVPNIIDKPLYIDVRSFGVRTPPCTVDDPTYGILGMFHLLPPALAWLWRLVSPRGYANPSIVHTEGLSSEGVGSYWPFATGRMATQANLLLEQFINTPDAINILCPVKHIGVWDVGFMPEWIMREYIPRRGNQFESNELREARCKLLGYSLNELIVEGTQIDVELLRVEKQPEVGTAAYDKGAKILEDFFRQQLKQFLTDDLHPTGRKIIECFLDGGTVTEYEELIPATSLFSD